MKRTLKMNIIESSEKGTTLVCVSKEQVETIMKEADRLGISINTPILLTEYRQKKMMNK